MISAIYASSLDVLVTSGTAKLTRQHWWNLLDFSGMSQSRWGGDRTWNGGRFGWGQVYDEVQDYLASGRYSETATKVEKGDETATKVEKCEGWKRAKKFLLVDGVLHYKHSVKGGEQRLRQGRVNNLHCHGRIQGEQSYLIMHCVTMYYLSSILQVVNWIHPSLTS